MRQGRPRTLTRDRPRSEVFGGLRRPVSAPVSEPGLYLPRLKLGREEAWSTITAVPGERGDCLVFVAGSSTLRTLVDRAVLDSAYGRSLTQAPTSRERLGGAQLVTTSIVASGCARPRRCSTRPSAHPEIRTRTSRTLKPVPLPVGLGGRAGVLLGFTWRTPAANRSVRPLSPRKPDVQLLAAGIAIPTGPDPATSRLTTGCSSN